ncbi:hypothetical protein [Calycomorphotria hydatis]|uniref:Uncharacterized protein n=1 Tax=Calycomorphotria hydatis TaxID=2528027 RepID=A0A517T8M9_9PLAN|nr:hypothetical protein [Calycomorphotria hydatis]QDT64742.1 hypothetical protein V22_19830 [Calycomorphotria hydatis]
MDNRSKITAALSSLLVRRSDDAFVIIEHSETQKFVQFAGSATELLVLDLPSQTLSETEFYIAVELFRKMGVIGIDHDVLDKPGGKVVGQQFSFNKTFRSVDAATRTVEDIFAIVYGFPADCNLEITEN